MRNRSLALLTAFAFATFACSSDDSASAPDTSPTEPTTTNAPTPQTTSPTEPSVTTDTNADDSTVLPAGDEPPSGEEMFSFEEHDLCDWIAPERIAEIVAAEYDWEGTAAEVGPEAEFLPLPGCGWMLIADENSAPDTFPNVAVWDGSSLYSESEVVVVDYQDFDMAEAEIGEWVSGHPALGDGAWFALGGWGAVQFGFPADGRVLEMMLSVPGSEWSEGYLAPMAAVAEQIMTELGWTS